MGIPSSDVMEAIVSWWSSVKSAVKKVVKAVKTVVKPVVRFIRASVRNLTRVIGTFALALAMYPLEAIPALINWPPKYLRLQVFILRDQNGAAVIDPAFVGPAVEGAQKIFKDKFNINLIPYSTQFVETLTDNAPLSALTPRCDSGAVADEFFRDAGEYYADHLAGWVSGIPISLWFPVTAYIVQHVQGKRGCSLMYTEYLTIGTDGIINDDTTLAHEIGHCCNLFHSGDSDNLMWSDWARGIGVTWNQRVLARGSRHVTYAPWR